MTPLDFAVSQAQQCLVLALELSLPILLTGMVIGVTFSVLQTLFQVQDPMLSFVPRTLGVAAALLFLAPWMLSLLRSFLESVFSRLSTLPLL